ncbi:DUF2125 domain-containing protein [Bartonella sp. CB60]|uniref:DUF2125 domain-containing protein n=1 Tax=Bartonella sp. CB60 TaxID=3113619 RepID=UPI00300E4C56
MMVVCKNIRKNGYPLRIGAGCDKFQFSWPLHDFFLSTESVVIGAPIYAPQLIEVDVHSPASIVVDKRMSVVSRWRNLVIETEPSWRMPQTFKLIAEGLEIFPLALSFGDKKFQEALESIITDRKTTQNSVEDQVSLENADDMTVLSLNQKSPLPKIMAEFVRFDFKNEKNDLLGHVAFDSIDLSAFMAHSFVDFPKINGNLTWIFKDMSNLFDANGKNGWKQRLYGKSGTLKRGELMFHTGGALRVSGPFSFDDEGYLTAKFELAFVQHTEFVTTMQHLFPKQANNLQVLFFILSSMPKNADNHPVLPLLITHGWVNLGFLKLGRLAPL